MKTKIEIKEVERILNELYEGIKGTIISCSERSRLNISSPVYVYGECELDSMDKILQIVAPKEGEVFLDLGFGTGKQIFTAAMLGSFAEIRGIEIMQDLYQTTTDALDRFREEYLPQLPEDFEFPEINLVRGDFLEEDFSDVNVAYMCSTCFSDEMMDGIARALEKTQPGTRVVTLTKPLPSDQFKEISHDFYKMTWGTSQVFIYEKLGETSQG